MERLSAILRHDRFNLSLSGQRPYPGSAGTGGLGRRPDASPDRRYAIENGPSSFDPAAPSWMPKSVFLMLTRNERLAGLRAHFEQETQLLTIRRDGEVVARGDLETAQGRAAIEGFFAENFASELKGRRRWSQAWATAFAMSRKSCLDHQPR